MATQIITCKPQKQPYREKSETLLKDRENDHFLFLLLFKHFSIYQQYKIPVKLSCLCSALLVDRLSHQWQPFHENIIGDNETKDYLRGRSSYLGKKSVRVQEARGVRDRLTLSALCRLLCVRVCVFASALPPFFTWLASTFFLVCFFFPYSQQLCLFHVLFSFIVC